MDYYLILNSSYRNKTISFIENNPPNNLNYKSRISPIFPYKRDDFIKPDFQQQETAILFCFSNDPFTVIGEIKSFYKEILKNLWYSHGMASIIIFGKTKKDFEKLLKDEKLNIRGYEIWIISKNQINEQYCSLQRCDPKKNNFIKTIKFKEDYELLIQELNISLQRAYSFASQYFPEQIKMFDSLVKKINKIIALYERELKKSDSYINSELDKLKAGLSFSEQLIEINSAITLLIAQGYSGFSPILESISNHQRYSLLGISSAFNAMFTIYQFVYSIFEKFQLDEIIKEEYDKKRLRGFDVIRPQKWIEDAPYLDEFKKRKIKKFDNYHLMYFSGRWGFHASLHTITAAVQCIYSAACAQWNLMTLTHEYMHAHVRALIDTIKFPSKENVKLQKIADIYSSSKMYNTEEFSIRNCLNLALLHYCQLLYIAKKSIKKDQQDGTIKKITTGEEVLKILKDNDQIINEIIVHTLDYNYFFGARHDIYLKSIWSSWAKVPKVIFEIEHYISRTIAALGSKIVGSNTHRFNKAVDNIKNVFTEMLLIDKNPILKRVLDILNDEKKLRNLDLEFHANIYLADIATHFLFSSEINYFILSDKLKHEEADDWTYAIEPFEFTEESSIESPIAFILDRLEKNCPTDPVSELEALTLWELYVITSVKNNKGV